jgi:hypothetical protein
MLTSYSLYTPREISTSTVIKSRNMRKHVERIGEMRNSHKDLVVKPEAKRPFGELKADERITL